MDNLHGVERGEDFITILSPGSWESAYKSGLKFSQIKLFIQANTSGAECEPYFQVWQGELCLPWMNVSKRTRSCAAC